MGLCQEGERGRRCERYRVSQLIPYTRVATLDDTLHAEASQFLAGLHTLGEQWGLSALDAEAKA